MRFPLRSSGCIRSFYDKFLSEICLLPSRLLKYSNIICTFQTKETFSNRGHKSNDSLKYFITDGC